MSSDKDKKDDLWGVPKERGFFTPWAEHFKPVKWESAKLLAKKEEEAKEEEEKKSSKKKVVKEDLDPDANKPSIQVKLSRDGRMSIVRATSQDEEEKPKESRPNEGRPSEGREVQLHNPLNGGESRAPSSQTAKTTVPDGNVDFFSASKAGGESGSILSQAAISGKQTPASQFLDQGGAEQDGPFSSLTTEKKVQKTLRRPIGSGPELAQPMATQLTAAGAAASDPPKPDSPPLLYNTGLVAEVLNKQNPNSNRPTNPPDAQSKSSAIQEKASFSSAGSRGNTLSAAEFMARTSDRDSVIAKLIGEEQTSPVPDDKNHYVRRAFELGQSKAVKNDKPPELDSAKIKEQLLENRPIIEPVFETGAFVKLEPSHAGELYGIVCSGPEINKYSKNVLVIPAERRNSPLLSPATPLLEPDGVLNGKCIARTDKLTFVSKDLVKEDLGVISDKNLSKVEQALGMAFSQREAKSSEG